MSDQVCVGAGGKARLSMDVCVGVGGVARRVKAAYAGDENGKARLFWRKILGVITPSNMTSNTAPAPFRAASKNYTAGYEAYCAFNSSADGGFAAANGQSQLSGDVPAGGEWWLDIDLGEEKIANRVRLRSAASNLPGTSSTTWSVARDFQVLGSNESAAWGENPTSDKWTEVGSVTDYAEGAPNNVWLPLVALDNPGHYRYYRLRVTRASRAASFLMTKNFELSMAKDSV
jgi:hypothetical protein